MEAVWAWVRCRVEQSGAQRCSCTRHPCQEPPGRVIIAFSSLCFFPRVKEQPVRGELGNRIAGQLTVLHARVTAPARLTRGRDVEAVALLSDI